MTQAWHFRLVRDYPNGVTLRQQVRWESPMILTPGAALMFTEGCRGRQLQSISPFSPLREWDGWTVETVALVAKEG